MMPSKLIRSGKGTCLSKLLKHIKGAVNYKGAITNPNTKPKTSSGSGIPKTTIQKAIDDIEKTYQISPEDALIIREVCEEVSEKDGIKTTVLNNRRNNLSLENYEPTVYLDIIASYIARDLWVNIDDPIYTDKGGIFSIMSKTVIQNIVSGAQVAQI
jgi:type I restriction enzyme R subunit